jgi:Na+(H+)/acetate symporter ActP
MEKRYTALRIIGTIYKVLGIIAAAITIIVALAFCLISMIGSGSLYNYYPRAWSGIFGGILGGLFLGVLVILYGGGMAITFFALGEGVDLLLALEENTRATTILLQSQVKPPAPPTPPSTPG